MPKTNNRIIEKIINYFENYIKSLIPNFNFSNATLKISHNPLILIYDISNCLQD